MNVVNDSGIYIYLSTLSSITAAFQSYASLGVERLADDDLASLCWLVQHYTCTLLHLVHEHLTVVVQ